MKPEEQRIAIAEACGWTHIENVTIAIGGIWKGYPPQNQLVGIRRPLPNYLSDLNAMHEAEKVLTDELCWCYGKQLVNLAVRNDENAFFDEPLNEFPLNDLGHFHLARATAAQRAEAFLRALNLWDNSK